LSFVVPGIADQHSQLPRASPNVRIRADYDADAALMNTWAGRGANIDCECGCGHCRSGRQRRPSGIATSPPTGFRHIARTFVDPAVVWCDRIPVNDRASGSIRGSRGSASTIRFIRGGIASTRVRGALTPKDQRDLYGARSGRVADIDGKNLPATLSVTSTASPIRRAPWN